LTGNPEQAAACWFEGATLRPLGAGHIHDTYRVSVAGQDFVLQRLNTAVFGAPEVLMEQTRGVLAHWSTQPHYHVPHLVADAQGRHGQWLAGDYWRMWTYVANSRVLDPPDSLDQATHAGAAFGFWQAHMQSLAGAWLVDILPGFLQLSHYLQAYDRVALQAPLACRQLIEHHRSLARALHARTHVIHGDCKVNNLLFNADATRVAAVIDFDTVMRGHWAWDLGDLVRSIWTSRGAVDPAFFGAVLRGFAAEQAACTVADSVAAPGYVTLMLGVRFLTDHLTGNTYFRVNREGENLARAEQQFELFERYVSAQGELRQIAANVLGSGA